MKVKELVKRNHEWADGVTANDPKFFSDLAAGQSPQFLWIGCSDSRVPAEQVCQLKPGDMFVHRNIANLIIPTDMSSMSVIQYAVEVLKVSDVIVCGHYGCGGVAASMANQSLGLIDGWLHSIKSTYNRNLDELNKLPDGSPEKINALVELNVAQQVLNFSQTSFAQNAWERGQELRVHGLVHSLATGKLKDLDIRISGKDQLPEVFRFKN